jgi:hypothetical protein
MSFRHARASLDADAGRIITTNARRTMVVSFLALVVIALMVYGAQRWAVPEASVARATPLAARQPKNKPKQCYLDSDCPDDTNCTDGGVCAPTLRRLIDPKPLSKDAKPPATGREGEKTV